MVSFCSIASEVFMWRVFGSISGTPYLFVHEEGHSNR